MEQSLNLTQAAKLIGCSRNTLYAAIRAGRLRCVMGGRPGTRTEVTASALQDAGFSIPVDLGETERAAERPVHAERAERPERSQRAERSARLERAAHADRLDFPIVTAESDRTSVQVERALERLERTLERTMDVLVDRMGERLERAVERTIERALERVIERLVDRRAREAIPALEVRPLQHASPATRSDKAAILPRIHQMHEGEGLSYQLIANRLNAEGVPTLSGHGQWQRGTIANLLAQARGAAE